MHSSINQFVVFEKFAEMNNKYDVGNFAKLLEEFELTHEMSHVDQFLYGKDQEPQTPKGDGEQDRSARGSTDSSTDDTSTVVNENKEI